MSDRVNIDDYDIPAMLKGSLKVSSEGPGGYLSTGIGFDQMFEYWLDEAIHDWRWNEYNVEWMKKEVERVKREIERYRRDRRAA